MKNGLVLLTTLLCLAACQSAQEIDTSLQPSIFDWLSTEEDLVTLEIKGDLTHLFVNRDGEDSYHPASLKIIRADSVHQFDLEISRRGVTRKKICDFPLIKLKFPKKTLAANGFANFKNYKLVTHCMSGENDYVLKEYLTYKLFNQLTDKSFQVKLAKIRYIDESGEVPDEEHYGFLIEANKELANRLDGKLLDPEKYKIARVDKEQYKNMVLFQYMIGNTDWNLSRGHNIKWVQTAASDVPSPIPYDFDYCGLVNAPYAIPHPQIPIKHVRERFLQWRGKNKTELLPICEKFKAQKADLIQICQDFKDINAATKEDIIGFLETFFEEVEHETFL